MENTHKLQERLTLALVCAVTLFPAGLLLLFFGSLFIIEDPGILSEVPVAFLVALVAGLAFAGLCMFALTSPTRARSQTIGRFALAAFVICIVAGVAAVGQLTDGCGGFGRAGLECSD